MCGTWQTTPHPAVTPRPRDLDHPVNDGQVAITQVGDDLPGRPTAIAIAPNGDVYVAVTYSTTYPLAYSSAIYGSIFLLDDTGSHLLIDGLNFPNGLAFIDNDLYISQLGKIARLSNVHGTMCDSVETVVDNLPFDEVHQTNGLAHHDGRLYVSQGYVYEPLESSRMDVRGTIFSVRPDGGDLQIEATGFRNAYGIAFDDQGRLWASDNGPNVNYDPGVTSEDEVTPDELDLVVPDGDYGFHPRHPDSHDATPVASPVVCAAASCGIAPAAEFQKHVTPAGVAWDSPNQQVLVALSSMWQIVAFNPDTGAMAPVLWNVSTPTALVAGPDGSLYVGEWTAQRVIRVNADDIPKVAS